MSSAAFSRPKDCRRPPALDSEQLALLKEQLSVQAGIKINSTHDVIGLCIRERMEYLNVNSADRYLEIFDDSINARAEWLALIDLLTVKETRFFRQPAAFECLAEHVEALVKNGSREAKEFSFWSAGCSHGHELYSMAMVVESIFAQGEPWLEWHGIGTDLSFQAISASQQGVYHEDCLGSIPPSYRHRYMEQKLGNRMKVSEEILSRTHFFHSNLLHVDSAPFADFNAIFCQNVLIYFPRKKQHWIIDQLVARLSHEGILILGAGEDAGWQNDNVQRLQWPGVCAYKKIGD
ncbi:MAG: protein-glutamate O-methyltransferase CheR [Halioglobus sp.]